MTFEQILAGGTFGCGGLLFVVVGVASFLPTILSRYFRRGSLPSDGIVTGYETEEDGENPTKYHPIIKYRDQTGAEHQAKVDGGPQKPFEINQRVEVMYLPDSPQAVWIEGYNPSRHLWLFGAVFVLMGSLSVLMGITIWVFRIPVNRG